MPLIAARVRLHELFNRVILQGSLAFVLKLHQGVLIRIASSSRMWPTNPCTSGVPGWLMSSWILHSAMLTPQVRLISSRVLLSACTEYD